MTMRMNLLSLLSLCGLLSACGGSNFYGTAFSKGGKAEINNSVKFSESSYGVAASPRVTASRNVRKGGGRRQIGRPYTIKGKTYAPKEEFGYDRTGQASWYGPNFHGRLTANGEIYDQYALTAAHPTFPLPSYARVRNLANGRSLIVRVNDRGPYHDGRIIDLSAKAAELLGYRHVGVARVQVEYLKQAPLDGLDQKVLEASYQDGPNAAPSGTEIATKNDLMDWRPSVERLAALTTGSIFSDSQGDTDPFITELKAVNAARADTGSTLALRMRPGLIAERQ
jgi:rare lipoprotein A